MSVPAVDLIRLLLLSFMDSLENIPSSNFQTSYSTKSVQAGPPCSEEVGFLTTDSPPASVYSRALESKGVPPPPVEPKSGGLQATATANEQPPQQATAQTTYNGLSNSTGLTGIFIKDTYVDRSYDYRRKYPPDAEGKELEPDARVWKVYLDECESYDNDMIRGFRDTIDSLLVFAALFSSVVTGFVVQTSQTLEPDYAQIGAYLLFEQIQVLRAAGNATAIKEIPRSHLAPDSITHSTLDIIINWLFFASLAFSLATAFIAVLIKQWLRAFTALIPGDAKQRSLTRQFRFTGLQKWKLPEIVNILPLFLHFSLAFFLIGLCFFVSRFHLSMPIMVGVVTFAAIAFYVVTGVLPAVYLNCPYRLPILYIPASFAVYAFRIIYFKVSQLLGMIHFKISKQIQSLSSDSTSDLDSRSFSNKPVHSIRRPSFSLFPLHSQEQRYISNTEMTLKLEGLSLAWLFSQTPNTSVHRIAIYGARRFLRADAFEFLRSWWADSKKGQFANHLRDSLNLDSMSMAAIRVFTVEKQPEDADLLRDAIVLFRQCSHHSLLPTSAWRHALNSPCAAEFLKEKVFPIGSESEISLELFMNMIEEAIDQETWDAVICLLQSSPEPLLQHKLSNGASILHAASVSKKISHEDWVAIFSIAMEEGVDFNTFKADIAGPDWSREEWTVLHSILQSGTVAALQHLISHVPNLDLDVCDWFASAPLHIACQHVRYAPEEMATTLTMVEILLEKGANAQPKDWRGKTPLHSFCTEGHPVYPIIQKLLSAGADPNTLDIDCYLALHVACETGFASFGCTQAGCNVMEMLITGTTNINELSKDGDTPLDLLEKSNGYQENKEEAKAGYLLMQKHGALRASDLRPVEEDRPPSAALQDQLTRN